MSNHWSDEALAYRQGSNPITEFLFDVQEDVFMMRLSAFALFIVVACIVIRICTKVDSLVDKAEYKRKHVRR